MADDATHLRIESAAADVRQFAGCDAYKTLMTMLDCTLSSYQQDLMTVTPEQLPRLQAAAAQVVAIRDVVAGKERALPRI